MKTRLLILTGLLLGFTNSYAQSVNGIAFKDLEVDYLEIVGENKPLSNKQIIGLEYGQVKTSVLYPYKDTKIKDANGKDVEFNYMIEALNFMVKNGYEFVQAYTSIEGEQNYYHYLLRKKKPE